MTEKPPQEIPPECLRDLVAWFDAAKVKGVVIGGVAVSILGPARFTRDVDALVILDEADWAGFLAAGAKHGFVPRVSDALGFAAHSRVLLLTHKPTQIDADISFGGLHFERDVIKRSKRMVYGDLKLPLPSAADLIILKAVAHRPQDLADIEKLLQTNPRVNLDRVRRIVKEFADVLEAPEIVESLDWIVSRRTK